MNKTEATKFHNELTAALAPILKKYNITMRRNNLSFGEREVKLSITMEQFNTDGTHKADDYTERQLRQELTALGVKNIPTTIVGSKVKSLMGETYTITGYNRRAQKYPIEAQSVRTGQMYKLTGRGLQFI